MGDFKRRQKVIYSFGDLRKKSASQLDQIIKEKHEEFFEATTENQKKINKILFLQNQIEKELK
jgi:hypothetical protein